MLLEKDLDPAVSEPAEAAALDLGNRLQIGGVALEAVCQFGKCQRR